MQSVVSEEEKKDYSEPLSVSYLSSHPPESQFRIPNSIRIPLLRGFFILCSLSFNPPPAKPILPVPSSAIPFRCHRIESQQKPTGPNPTETKQKAKRPRPPNPNSQLAIRHPFPCCADSIHYPPSRADTVVIRRAPATLAQPSDTPSHTLFCVLRAAACCVSLSESGRDCATGRALKE